MVLRFWFKRYIKITVCPETCHSTKTFIRFIVIESLLQVEWADSQELRSTERYNNFHRFTVPSVFSFLPFRQQPWRNKPRNSGLTISRAFVARAPLSKGDKAACWNFYKIRNQLASVPSSIRISMKDNLRQPVPVHPCYRFLRALLSITCTYLYHPAFIESDHERGSKSTKKREKDRTTVNEAAGRKLVYASYPCSRRDGSNFEARAKSLHAMRPIL